MFPLIAEMWHCVHEVTSRVIWDYNIHRSRGKISCFKEPKRFIICHTRGEHKQLLYVSQNATVVQADEEGMLITW